MKHTIAAVSAFVWTTSALNTQAQEIYLEEVVVTAQKIERSLHNTKESIAVVSSQDIERRRLLTLEDVYNQTANAFDLGGNEGFGIRGVSHNSQSTQGGGGELATYFIDGVAITGFAKRFVPMDMWDVDQIEILRGPQSTNLGRNAMIGAVVVNTQRPELDTFDINFMAGAGNDDRYDAAGTVNAPLGDIGAVRLSAEYLEYEGYIDNVTRNEDDYDARENTTLRGKVLLEPTDQLSIYANIQYVESNRGQNIIRFDLNDDLDDRHAFDNLPSKEDMDGYLATLDVSYDINELFSLRSITSWLDTDYERFDDDDLSALGGNAFRGRKASDDNWAEELRLEYTGENLRGTMGVYYTEVELENDTLGLVNIDPVLVGVPDPLLPFYPPVIEINVLSPFEGDTENFALFTDWEYDVNEKWSVSFGARYEEEEQDNVSRINNSLVDPDALPDPAVVEQIAGPVVAGFVTQVNAALLAQLEPSEERTSPDFDVTLFKAGVTHRFNDNVNLSFFFNQGYRAGGSELSLAGTANDYDEEYLDNYELALRSRFFDGRVNLNANVYYGDWDDQQVTIGLNGNIFDTITENVGESTIYGGELELNATPSDDLVLFATLGYSKTEFDDYVSDVDGDQSGNEFAFSPNWTGAIGGTYYFGRFHVGANVTYQDDSYADVQNEIKLDDRTLLNMQAGYTGEIYRVSLYGKNLTDKTYVTSEGAGLIPGSVVGRVGEPREYGMRLTVEL